MILKSVFFYGIALGVGSWLKRKREYGKTPRLRYIGTVVMMLWCSVLMLTMTCGHFFSLHLDDWMEWVDPFFFDPKNWLGPLLLAVLLIFGALIFARWSVVLENETILAKRWPLRSKLLKVSELRGIERNRAKTAAVLHFLHGQDFKITRYMSGQDFFLRALELEKEKLRQRNITSQL